MSYCNVTGGGVDYNSGPYTVIFPNGSTNASFNIIINDDNVLEESEVFVISIESVTYGTVGTPRNARVNIIDTTSMLLFYDIYVYVCNSCMGKRDLPDMYTQA